MMYFSTTIVLLLAALFNVEGNNAEQLTECYGGNCVPKHLCPTGILGQKGVPTVRIGEVNECEDFMKICCKESNRISNMNDKCGISNPQGLVYNVESEIAYAKYAEFPWTVAIFQRSSSSNNAELAHVGGGTLIHPKFVLTVAHLLMKPYRYVARFGEWNMKSDAEIYATQDIQIEEHILHPFYLDEEPPENDIALAVLKRNVIYSNHIRPLCLPSAQDVFDERKCIATGWGLDVRTGQPASIMKRMELIINSRDKCQMLYRELDIPFLQHRSVICASQAEDQNTCINDDGISLACQRDDGSYVLAGIASWVVDCGRPNIPSGHVDVAKFASWIQDAIEVYEQGGKQGNMQGGRIREIPVR